MRRSKGFCFPSLMVLTLVVGLLGCTKPHEPEVVVTTINEPADEFRVPQKMWAEFGAENQSYELAPVQVLLTEKTQNTLKAPKAILEFQKGGGVVDLNLYLTSNIGTFHLDFLSEGKRPDKIVFISQSPTRIQDSMVYGDGCQTYMVMDHLFSEFPQGIPINTKFNGQNVLLGHFILMWKDEEKKKSLISHVGFTDLENPGALCLN